MSHFNEPKVKDSSRRPFKKHTIALNKTHPYTTTYDRGQVQEKATDKARSTFKVLRPKEACRSNHPGIPARTTTSRQRERGAKGRSNRREIEFAELSTT